MRAEARVIRSYVTTRSWTAEAIAVELKPLAWPRWGRAAAHVPTTVNELHDRGITVMSLTENFDLATKEGRFMFTVLAATSEYEVELRAERQAEGIAAAKRRPPVPRCPARRRLAAPAQHQRAHMTLNFFNVTLIPSPGE